MSLALWVPALHCINISSWENFAAWTAWDFVGESHGTWRCLLLVRTDYKGDALNQKPGPWHSGASTFVAHEEHSRVLSKVVPVRGKTVKTISVKLFLVVPHYKILVVHPYSFSSAQLGKAATSWGPIHWLSKGQRQNIEPSWCRMAWMCFLFYGKIELFDRILNRWLNLLFSFKQTSLICVAWTLVCDLFCTTSVRFCADEKVSKTLRNVLYNYRHFFVCHPLRLRSKKLSFLLIWKLFSSRHLVFSIAVEGVVEQNRDSQFFLRSKKGFKQSISARIRSFPCYINPA